MSSLPNSSVQDPYAQFHGPKWSHSEKAIARRAFDNALQKELEEVIQEAKKMAEKVKLPSDLRELESYLTRRHEIDREYDYRYSILHVVFRNLIQKGRLSEKDLDGLGEDKLSLIRALVTFAERT